MTLTQFLRKLRDKRKREGVRFKLEDYSFLRTEDRHHCPLSYVAGNKPCVFDEAAKLLKIPTELATQIADAADRCPVIRTVDGVVVSPPEEAELLAIRVRLLRACGIPA